MSNNINKRGNNNYHDITKSYNNKTSIIIKASFFYLKIVSLISNQATSNIYYK